MDRVSQDEHMTDAGAGDSSPQVASLPAYVKSLPTPLTATSPRFPNSLSSNDTPLTSPMASSFSPEKGKNKRLVDEEMENDSSSTATNTMAASKPVSRLTAPKLLGRHHHRRRNVAATVWGPYLPGSDVPQPFNIFKAILRHPNLFFQFAIRLPPQTMIDLYAIDKEFHYRFNKYSTSIIHDFASYHAPQAAYIFSWIMFPELCISDPMLRPMDNRPHLARDIPSLRWTKLVLYRDEVVRRILTCLGTEGHRVPRATHTVLMKFWLLMEMNTTPLRKAFLSDKNVWSDEDIVIFHLFLMKLDMYFCHPVYGHGFIDLSHMLMAQKTLSKLHDVMTGKYVLDYDEATDLMVRTYHVDDLDTDTHPWMGDETENGVPMEESGILCLEGWDLEGEKMMPAIDMVSVEGIKRRLNVQQYLADFVVYGYVDLDTGKNIPYPRRLRHEKKIAVPKEAWPTEDVRKGMIANLDKKFGVDGVGEGRILKPTVRIEGRDVQLVIWESKLKKDEAAKEDEKDEMVIDG